MRTKEHTKKVIIKSRGPIPSKGFINGPILSPYHETIHNIFSLVASGIEVVEITDSGEEIALNISNFDKEHNDRVLAEVAGKPSVDTSSNFKNVAKQKKKETNTLSTDNSKKEKSAFIVENDLDETLEEK